jgi:hypothetical protein
MTEHRAADERITSGGLGSPNTGVSPYFMVYGAEAVLPSDVAFRSPGVEHSD